MLTILAAAAAAASVPAAAPSANPACRYDRAAMLALELQAFDQDMTGGWRRLANAGCFAEAADLLRDWRSAHGANATILTWHEGQMRAIAGQTAQAIALFEQSRRAGAGDPTGWNLYVDGSIAFLRRDRPALEAARAGLAALPRPETWNPIGPDGRPIPVAWPPNLNVLDDFLSCWDQPYRTAYGCGARARATSG